MQQQPFYGWTILAACFLILAVDGGVRFSFGVLIKPLALEFAWDRSAITFAYTLNMLVFGLCQFLAGRLLDQYGPRILFSVSALVATVGLVLTSQTNSLPEFYLYYGVITAIGISGITIGVVSATVSRWFQSLRGFLSGVAITGTSFGHFLIIPFLAFLLSEYGWRLSWIVLGILASAVVIPLSLAVMRKDPAEIGQEPYEYGDTAVRQRAKQLVSSKSPRQAFLSRSFLVIGTTYFICGAQDFFFVTQFIAFANDQGLTLQEASNIQGLAGLLSFLGLLFFPTLSERFGQGLPISLLFLLRIIGFSFLVFSPDTTSIYVWGLLMGFTLMATAPLAAALAAQRYGLKHIGLLIGAIFWIHHTGGAAGAYLGGLLYDTHHTYELAFTTGLALSLLAALTSLGIRAEERRSRP